MGIPREPPFLGEESSDRRSDLVLEILRALYALDTSNPTATRAPKETKTRIGNVLCELLQFSNADERMYQVKLAEVTLLHNALDGYSGYLIEKGGIQPLVDIMSYQTSLVVERTGRCRGRRSHPTRFTQYRQFELRSACISDGEVSVL